MPRASQRAPLRLGQSPRRNFLLSQAAGFHIPNPKQAVSSSPGIFQRQFETQPSPRWGCNSSPDRFAAGLVVGQDGQAGLQLAGAAAIPGDNTSPPNPQNQVILAILSSSE